MAFDSFDGLACMEVLSQGYLKLGGHHTISAIIYILRQYFPGEVLELQYLCSKLQIRVSAE